MPTIQDLPFVFDMSADDDVPWDYEALDATTTPLGDSSSPHEAHWRCWTCGHAEFEWSDHWVCASCGSVEFYNTRQSERRETREGVWLYMPRQTSWDTPDSKLAAPPFGSPPNTSGHDFGEDRELAESETPTHDPIVDPDGSQTRRQRRRHRKSNASQEQQQVQADESDADIKQNLDKIVTMLKKSMSNEKSNSSQDSWNSRKGPEKGVRFRGGTPPNPPTWKYSRDDIRSVPKWQKKLAVWKKQIQAYMPLQDAALMLYTSLSGEPEEELEHIDLDRLHRSDGIDYIESLLRQGLETKLIYQKRKLMSEFETIVRQPSESMRAFVNRYRRAERSLQSIGVNPSGMYDSEAMGNRLLERARLSPENGRLVLIGSNFNLTFESIAESLCMTFPEHKPPPQLFGKDGQPIKAFQHRRDIAPSSHSSSLSSTTATSSSSFKGKGKGKNKFQSRQAFATEQVELEAVPEENDDEEDGNTEFHDAEDWQDDEQPPEEDEAAYDDADEETDLSAVVDVLTVTAKKLQSLTLGRKYTGTRTIQERKRTSSCSACGQIGHWAGDGMRKVDFQVLCQSQRQS